MLNLIIGIIIGAFGMKYMDNKEFKEKVNASIKGWFSSKKTRK